MLISTVWALLSLCIPELMMKILTSDAELITLGASYLRILSVAYFCWGIIESLLPVHPE